MLEFKGGLHTSCLRPWAFKDKYLERMFQEYMSTSVLDRTRFLIFFLVCCAWAVRAIHLVLRLVFPYDWTRKELIVLIARLSLHSLVTLAVFIEWSHPYKVTISKALLWLPRISSIILFAEQAGEQQDDSSMLLLPLGPTVLSLMIPSYGEFLWFAAVLFMSKPVCILLMGRDGCPSGVRAPCPGRDFQTVLVQNACLLFTAVAVFFHVFSDTRRRWLLSFEVFGPLNELGPASAARLSSDGHGAGAAEEWGAPAAHGESEEEDADALHHDSYFPPGERAEQLDAWRRERAEMAARDQDGRGAPAIAGAPGISGADGRS